MRSSWEEVQLSEDRALKKQIKEEIMSMKPGRELDILVQEEVLQEERDRCFHPSINMGDAWRVVEHIQKEGWTFFVKGDSDGWFANFTKSNIYYLEKGDTAPHAICIAALLAVMEVEK